MSRRMDDQLGAFDSNHDQAALVDDDMICHPIVVQAEAVVEVKALVEAWEGVASVFAEKAGQLTLAAPRSREAELRELLVAVAEVTGSARP